MRTLTEFNRGRVGMMGAVVTVLVVGVAQSFTSVPMLFATPTYYAQFADTGGINTGDKVEIAGVNVGLVRSLAIRGNRVLIGFSLPGKTIGMQSRAADWFTKSDHDLADTVERIDDVLGTVRKFVSDNRSVLAADVNNLADATTTLVQPEPRDGLETALHVLPTYASNFNNLYYPLHSSLVGQFVFPNFANPIQLICSAIQAGSRLGYQESAELCAQYLAPVLDALKFNYLPFGSNPFSSAATLPKEVAYSEERLRPPPGYKDTTVPGIFSRDTPFSHGNHEPGWVVAPGMQGMQVQPFTANMLTPESLAELLGGPDIAPPPPGTNLPGPPNAYDESNPLPPPWYPQPASLPAAGATGQPGPGQ